MQNTRKICQICENASMISSQTVLFQNVEHLRTFFKALIIRLILHNMKLSKKV